MELPCVKESKIVRSVSSYRPTSGTVELSRLRSINTIACDLRAAENFQIRSSRAGNSCGFCGNARELWNVRRKSAWNHHSAIKASKKR